MHGNPRIPDLSIIGHHRSIFLLPGKVSIVTEASGPACKRQVAHTLGQLQMVLGFWITFWVTHIQSARKKTNWTVTNNRLYWFGVLFVHCFLEPFPHASSWAHHQFEWAMCDGGSPWVFISTLFFFSCSSIAKILLFLCRYYILCMYSSGSPSVWRSQIFMIWTQCSVAWSRLKCLSLTSRRLWICVYMNKGRSYYPK